MFEVFIALKAGFSSTRWNWTSIIFLVLEISVFLMFLLMFPACSVNCLLKCIGHYFSSSIGVPSNDIIVFASILFGLLRPLVVFVSFLVLGWMVALLRCCNNFCFFLCSFTTCVTLSVSFLRSWDDFYRFWREIWFTHWDSKSWYSRFAGFHQHLCEHFFSHFLYIFWWTIAHDCVCMLVANRPGWNSWMFYLQPS